VNDARWTVDRRDVTVVRVESAEHWTEARRLVNEYATSLTFDLAFQDFDREILSLETEYGPPDGGFLLAGFADEWIGCGGVRRFSAVDCEMKRLYVRPSGRGHGLGRVLAQTLIAAARDLGYQRMLLDTTPSMTSAQDLYASLGFTRTTPYRYNPIDGATFWQLNL
jgi:GNAT superfamily N-acetyltransferase